MVNIQKIKRYLYFTLLLLPIALFGVILYASYIILHPPRHIVKGNPSDYGLNWEEIEFQNREQVTLRGWFLKGTNGATVILLHGYGKSRFEVFQQACDLNKAGFNTLLFDFRESGTSGEGIVTLGVKEGQDLQAAIDYLLSRSDVNPDKIGLFGFSMGGAIAIQGAAESSHIQAVAVHAAFARADQVLQNNYKRFTRGWLPFYPIGWLVIKLAEAQANITFSDFVPIEYIAMISPKPILMVQGDSDDRVSLSEAKSLYQQAKEPKELHVFSGVDHFNIYEKAEEEYRLLLIEFFKKNLHVD